MGSSISNLPTSNMKPSLVALDILKEAEDYGYDTSSSKEFKSSSPVEVADDVIARAQELINTQEHLNKVNWEVALYNTYHSSTGHPYAIDEKVRKLTDELQRIQRVIDHQVQIETCLQSRDDSQSLPIHAKHHKAVIELIYMMPRMMTELKSNLECLKWLLTFSPNKNLDKLCADVTKLYTSLKIAANSLEDYQFAILNHRSDGCDRRFSDKE